MVEGQGVGGHGGVEVGHGGLVEAVQRPGGVDAGVVGEELV
ncbi:MAG: hypothetical protein ACR2GH_16670 [Pseudonocardia sp.]